MADPQAAVPPETPIEDATDAMRARFALIGGAAMPAWGHDRSTRDVDVIVFVDPAEEKDWIARIVEALRARGFAHMDRADRKRLDREYLRKWADALGLTERPWESGARG